MRKEEHQRRSSEDPTKTRGQENGSVIFFLCGVPLCNSVLSVVKVLQFSGFSSFRILGFRGARVFLQLSAYQIGDGFAPANDFG